VTSKRISRRAADLSRPASLKIPWLKERIESFAPPDRKQEREALYCDLKHHVGDETISDLDGLVFLLGTIVQAHFIDAETTQHAEKERRKIGPYWKDRNRLEQKFNKLRDHPMVRRLEWDFFLPDQACPHGRHRRECEASYEQRESFRLLDQPPLNKTLPKLVARLARKRRALLEQPADAFCRPTVYPVPEATKLRRGRPRDELKNYLVERFRSGPIQKARKELSFELLRKILESCFGETVEANSLGTFAQRLQKGRGSESEEHPGST
jgi:hypothetical protein